MQSLPRAITHKNATMDHANEGPPTLEIDASTAIATLRLRRPSQRNALTDADLKALQQHLQAVDRNPAVRVLVVRASTAGQARPVFCAGYHFAGFEDPAHDPDLFEHVADALAQARPVTICALGGSVYGGATDLVLACDLRLGLAGCEFRMPAGALGIHYYASGVRRYVSRLGLDIAKQAFLTARALPLERLHALGVLVDVLAQDRFDAALEELATQVAALAPLAVQSLKQSLNEVAQGVAHDQQLRERGARSRASADFAEGRAAIAERRAPRFRGA